MYGEHHRFRIRERKRKAVILCTDKKNVLYQHLEHKGHDGLTKTPVKDFDGILIHDHDKSYYSYGSKHQECLAHVLRYLVGAMENEPDLKWHRQMHSLLQKMIHTAKKYVDGVVHFSIEKEHNLQVMLLCILGYLAFVFMCLSPRSMHRLRPLCIHPVLCRRAGICLHWHPLSD